MSHLHSVIRSEQLEAVKEELVVEREQVIALKSRLDQMAEAKVCDDSMQGVYC